MTILFLLGYSHFLCWPLSFFNWVRVFICVCVCVCVCVWLCWVFVVVCGLSLVAASGVHFLVAMGRFLTVVTSLSGGPICSVACGIFPNWEAKPCPLHWQADS